MGCFLIAWNVAYDDVYEDQLTYLMLGIPYARVVEAYVRRSFENTVTQIEPAMAAFSKGQGCGIGVVESLG